MKPQLSSMVARTLCVIAAFSIMSGFSGCRTSKPVAQESSMTSDADSTLPSSKGQELFLTHCINCHQGTGNPPGPNAVVIDSSRLNSEASFRSLLRQPTSAMMRSFSEAELDNASVHTLYEYLVAIRQPKK